MVAVQQLPPGYRPRRRFASSWPGRCTWCRVEYQTGDEVWWGRNRGTICPDCNKIENASIEEGIAEIRERRKHRQTEGRAKAHAKQRAQAKERRRLILLAAVQCGHHFTVPDVERNLTRMRGQVETTLDPYQWPRGSLHSYIKEFVRDGLAMAWDLVPGQGPRRFTWVDDDDSDDWPPV